MFTISYGVKPELREQYLSLIKQLREHLRNVARKDYAVFETKGKSNQFTEVFTTASLEEYDMLEDNLDERAEELISQLEECVDEHGMRYTTLIESE
jgi:hypothetical protein